MPKIDIDVGAHLNELARKARERAEEVTRVAGRSAPQARYLLGAASSYEAAARMCREGDGFWERYSKSLAPVEAF